MTIVLILILGFLLIVCVSITVVSFIDKNYDIPILFTFCVLLLCFALYITINDYKKNKPELAPRIEHVGSAKEVVE